MLDFWYALIGGGFAGAALVGILFQFLLKTQLEKVTKKYQHELDLRKVELQSELAVYAESKKVHLADHQQKLIEALEACYSAVISTSLPRQRFIKNLRVRNFQGTPEERDISEHFQLFSENFQAFSRAFQSVTAAFEKCEDHAIYLDAELENEVLNALKAIQIFYSRKHEALEQAHQNGKNDQNFNFHEFYDTMLQQWLLETGQIRQALKGRLRSVITPQAHET